MEYDGLDVGCGKVELVEFVEVLEAQRSQYAGEIADLLDDEVYVCGEELEGSRGIGEGGLGLRASL